MAQFATFYAGAMSESRDIDLFALGQDFDLVLVGPDDPEGMLRHTRACRDSGIPFAADVSQQLAWAEGDVIRDLIDGATYLFSNDYEAALIEQKTGWSSADVQAHVGTRIVTRGKDGVTVYPADGEPHRGQGHRGRRRGRPDRRRRQLPRRIPRGRRGRTRLRALGPDRLHDRRQRRRDQGHAGVRARPRRASSSGSARRTVSRRSAEVDAALSLA